MLELNDIAYIDLQKTGSTTVSSILKKTFHGHKRRAVVHGPVPEEFDIKKLTFVSVREPLSLSLSLFSFGAADKRGYLYDNMMRKGYSGLYEPTTRGFERWLDFFTDPRRAQALDANYFRSSTYDDIGLLSFRLLYMSIPNALSSMTRLGSGKRGVKRILKYKRVYGDYVRTENLVADLFDFLKRHERELTFKRPLTTASDLNALARKKNSGKKIDGLEIKSISQELRQRLISREWLIYREFGYSDDPKGIPSDQNPRFNRRE